MNAFLVPLCSDDIAAHAALVNYVPHLGLVAFEVGKDLSLIRPDLHIFLERLHVLPFPSQTPTPYDVLGQTLLLADTLSVTTFVFRSSEHFAFPIVLLMMELRRRNKNIILVGPPQQVGDALSLVDVIFPFEDEKTCEMLHNLT